MQRLLIKNEECIISYLTLRKLIGILGILLPFACLFGGSLFQHLPLKDSISAYYHTNMRDVFVGIIIGFSFFLLSYKGYELRDTLMAIASGVAGLGIAMFPCNCPGASPSGVGVFQLSPDTTGYIHYGSACTFFILLGINSCFLFTLGDEKKWTKSKSRRNVVYRACGIAIFVSLATLGLLTAIMGKDQLGETSWTFVFETVMLLSFGISWLVKGETIFAPKEGEPTFDLADYRRMQRAS